MLVVEVKLKKLNHPTEHPVFILQLSTKLNEVDDHGVLPLDIALKTHQEDLAQTLVENNVNINQLDENGASLLHLAIDRGN